MSSHSSDRSFARYALIGLPVAATFIALFWPTFLWMAERFEAHNSFYSHGWLVPLASGWLVWQRREVLRRAPLQAEAGGLWLLIPAVVVHVLATWWRLGFVSGFAMIAAVWGLAWTCWGRAALRVLRFPLLFLLFMVPLPSILLIATSFKMKLLAASLATPVLHVLGIAAVQAGSTIQVPPALSVIIDDTCSGLRSLISLLALAMLWTALLPAAATWRHRWLLMASAVPIALVANVARIVLLILLAVVYGPAAAEGFLHYGSGFVVFGVALAALAWLTKRLVRTA